MLTEFCILRFTNREVIQWHESICNTILGKTNKHLIKGFWTVVFLFQLKQGNFSQTTPDPQKTQVSGRSFFIVHTGPGLTFYRLLY